MPTPTPMPANDPAALLLSLPPDPDPAAELEPLGPCPSPHRLIESRVWAALVELDTAVALGRRHADRAAPSAIEAHDSVAALACVAEALVTVARAVAGDVAARGVTRGHGHEWVYREGPALEVAAAVESAARLGEFVAGSLTTAAGKAAVLAQVPPWPSHEHRPAVPHRPMRVVAVIA